jgi:capsular exopolysaccharide synthesis family protein
MTLRDYGRVIIRRRWLISIAVLASVAVSLLMAFLTDPIYEADAQMLVQTQDSGGLFDDDSRPIRDEVRAIDTEIQVLVGDEVRQRVQDALGSPQPPPRATAHTVGDTDVVAVVVRSADSRTAQILADAYVNAFIGLRRDQAIEGMLVTTQALQTQINRLQQQIDDLSPFDNRRQQLLLQQAQFEQALYQAQVDASIESGGVSRVESAERPTSPVAPQPVRDVVLAALVGLFIGLAAAFLVDYLDDSIVSADDLRTLSTLPTLATLPLRGSGSLRPLAMTHPNEHAVEIYRGMRTSVQILGLDRPIRTLQITSALAGEGKTTTASNLAVVLAQSGKRVVIVDTDQRHPRIHQVFDVPQHPGLTDLILGHPVDTVAHRVDIDEFTGLDVIASGPLSPQPSDTLSSQAMRDVLNSLVVRYDYVIIDSAPVLPVTDAVATAPNVDAVLLVVGAGTSSRTMAAALSRLDQVAAPVIGTVLNKATSAQHASYEYSSYLPPAGASVN